jgi:hypothetical protein
MTRISVTYPDLPPPYPVNNGDDSGQDTGLDDPPPEYATLPPPSVVDYPATVIPPPPANDPPAIQPAAPDASVKTVRKKPARIKMVPKVIHVPQFVYTEEETHISGRAGNVTMEVREMSQQTVSVINSVFEVGVATISIVGALFALIFNWRQKRRGERQRREEQTRFEEWRQQGHIPADENFVPSGTRFRRRELSKRAHSRAWQIEPLD